jgi:hypothetical protein
MANIRAESSGESMEQAKEWVKGAKGNRFWADVFA